MRSVHIRAVTSADAAAIAALNVVVQRLHRSAHPNWFKPPEPNAFERTLQDLLVRDGVFGFIAEDDGGGAIGYVLAIRRCRSETALTKGADILELDQIAVLPAHQHRGVGRALVARVFDIAEQVGVSRVELGVWDFNLEAQEFFASLGFSPLLRRMAFEFDGAAIERRQGE